MAVSLDGELWERALHGCDNPICASVFVAGDFGLIHRTRGSQWRTWSGWAAAVAAVAGGRSGGRAAVLERRERLVALRAAVRDGWDAEAARDALFGTGVSALW